MLDFQRDAQHPCGREQDLMPPPVTSNISQGSESAWMTEAAGTIPRLWSSSGERSPKQRVIFMGELLGNPILFALVDRFPFFQKSAHPFLLILAGEGHGKTGILNCCGRVQIRFGGVLNAVFCKPQCHRAVSRH